MEEFVKVVVPDESEQRKIDELKTGMEDAKVRVAALEAKIASEEAAIKAFVEEHGKVISELQKDAEAVLHERYGLGDKLSRMLRGMVGLPLKILVIDSEPYATLDESGRFVVCRWPCRDDFMEKHVQEALEREKAEAAAR